MALQKIGKSPRPNKSSRTGLVQHLVDGLHQLIAQRPLKAGDQLPTETQLIARFKVSRTVVREAISHLQAAGVVRTQHGVGSFVANPLGEPRAESSAELTAALREIEILKQKILELEIALSRLEPAQIDS